MYIGIFSAFLAALLAAPPAVTIQAERLSDRPVLRPAAPSWMEAGAFNPAAVSVNGKTVLLFRARDVRGTSRIGYAESADGLHFKIDPRPVLDPAAAYERGGGVEDPRVLRIGTIYYMTYTGYNRHDAQLCLATSCRSASTVSGGCITWAHAAIPTGRIAIIWDWPVRTTCCTGPMPPNSRYSSAGRAL